MEPNYYKLYELLSSNDSSISEPDADRAVQELFRNPKVLEVLLRDWPIVHGFGRLNPATTRAWSSITMSSLNFMQALRSIT